MSIRRLTTRRGSLCPLLLIVVVVALFVSAGSPIVPGSAAAGARNASPDVHVWLTTVDGTEKLTPISGVSFTRGQPTVPTVVVDPSHSFQSMVGFGGSITDSSAVVLYRLSLSARATAMRMLFDPRTGDGLSYLRQPIGASTSSPTRPTPTTISQPARPTIRSGTSASPTTRLRSCRCCAGPSA